VGFAAEDARRVGGDAKRLVAAVAASVGTSSSASSSPCCTCCSCCMEPGDEDAHVGVVID
jgi:hypothetical protein